MKVMPAFAVMSSSCGIGRPVHLVALAPGGGAEPCATPCAETRCTGAKKNDTITATAADPTTRRAKGRAEQRRVYPAGAK